MLFHFLSEPELGKNMSTIGDLSKRLLSRMPNVEPILSQQFLQHGTNILVETSETRSTSVDQDDEDNGSKGKTNSSSDKGKSKALEANSEDSQKTENKKGKGNKSKKKNNRKGGKKG
jgi:hypothetical protein